MKITGVETYPVWGGERNYLFVVVDTNEGLYGVGEAGLTGRELTVTGMIEHFEPILLEKDPFRTEHLWRLLFRGGFFPARPAVSAAISTVAQRDRSRSKIPSRARGGGPRDPGRDIGPGFLYGIARTPSQDEAGEAPSFSGALSTPRRPVRRWCRENTA